MKPKNVLKSAALGGILLLASGADAQVLDCNVFLQASHLEVGISPSGSYGSSVTAPIGYHGNTNGGPFRPCGGSGSTGNVGFVVDPARDGWAVGTPPYFGDYFLPGSPFEGWSLQVDTAHRRDAWNTLSTGFTGSLTGANIGYTSGAVLATTWQGTTDSVQITQVTTLDTAQLFFTVRITLTNLGHLPKNDVYYLRTVDPDNDELLSGSFATSNYVEHQSIDTTVVSANGRTFTTAYLALGTIDTNAECFIYAGWPPSDTISIASMYNHSAGAGYIYSGLNPDDYAIALAFRVAHLATVDSVGDSTHRYTPLHAVNSSSFSYFYAFSPAARDSAIAYLNRLYTAPPVLGVNEVAEAALTVYPNPANNVINVTGLKMHEQVILYDMMGRPTQLSANVSSNGANSYSTSNLPTGNYLLQVRDVNGNVRSRVRVQKQ